MTAPQGSRPVRVGAIADHGISSDAEVTTQKMREANLDLVIHAGDISYANDVGAGGVADQTIWDDYQNQIQPLAATVPHMYAPGNHEEEAYYDFDAYETRFYVQGSNPFWYSFIFESIYFISLSSEHDYEPGSQQYNWLEGELQAVDRQATPWLVVFAHRPMYSSNSAHGSEVEFRDAMEGLLYDYGVDLAIWGHDHSYERSYPVFQEEPLSNSTSSAEEPYYNPGAPIHVVAGMSGRSIYDEFDEPQPAWSAYREAVYGYTVFEVTPQGELHFSFIRNSDGAVADQFWISKVEPSPEPDGSDNNATTPDGSTSDSESAWQQKLEELPGPGLPIALGAIVIAARRRR
ncbi:MAG: purple acid phosphatase, partial [Candidatus Thermoplasmatota archaeon]|nr:purple acid phosphatase [Candidatus Thermoplasmatota archaeon]